MKKILLCLSLMICFCTAGVFAYSGHYTNMDITAIRESGQDDQHFVMEGKFIEHLRKDDYVFEDMTGKTMAVEVDDDCFVQLNQPVRVYGEIDVKHNGRIEVEIERIEKR